MDDSPPASLSANPKRPGSLLFLSMAEWIAAIAICGCLIWQHGEFYRNAGGLWRDEINSVNVATSPSFEVLWQRAKYDLYPPLWVLCLRAWPGGAVDPGDVHWRQIGLGIGLTVLALLFLIGLGLRESGQPWHAPLWILTAVAAHPTVLIFGDSLRAHGLSLLTMLAMCIAVWKVVEKRSLVTVIVAMVIATAAVFSSYYNCLLLLALCLAGAVTAGVRRDGKTIVSLSAVGLTAAVALFGVYGRQILVSSEWRVLQKMPFDELKPATRWLDMLTVAGEFTPWIWGMVTLAGLVILGTEINRARRNGITTSAPSLALFLAVSLLMAPVSYFAFLYSVRFVTGPWYFLMLTAFVGVCLEQAINLFIQKKAALRWVRLVIVLLLFGHTYPELKAHTNRRMTNVDLAAKVLEQTANPRDLIVVNSWWLSLPFDRYYHGPTPWIMVPEIDDRKVMRYDLIKKRMAEQHPLASVFSKMNETLRGGGRVFVVGTLLSLPPDEPRQRLPPAPQAKTGWQEFPYLNDWSVQLADHIQTTTRERHFVSVPQDRPINPQEEVDVFVGIGWTGR